MKSKSTYKSDIFTIPNLLSVFRFALIPLFMWLYLAKEKYALTAAVLALSGFTDVADGFIARKFNMVSDLGKAIDPVADKLTQAAMLFCLVSSFRHMAIPLILLAVKEFVTGFSNIAAIKKTGEVCYARWHGKMTTVLLYTMLFTHVVWHDIPSVVSDCFIGICTVSMLLSFTLYITDDIKILKKK